MPGKVRSSWRPPEQKALISVTEATKDPSYSLPKAGSNIWVSGSHPHPDLRDTPANILLCLSCAYLEAKMKVPKTRKLVSLGTGTFESDS